MNSNIKVSSNRSFGLVFFVFFLIIGLYPLVNNEVIKIWSLIISLFFLVLGLLNSKYLDPLNKIWFKFGIVLGSVISPVVMGLIFFFVVTPIALIMKLFRKDVLNLKFNSNKSYWIKKVDHKSDMRKQF